MEFLRQLYDKTKKLHTIILSGALLLIVLIFVLFLTISNIGEEEAITFSGNLETNFRVHYLPNDFFETNPVPHSLNFLMSFTDFIEIDNRFTASFHEIVDVQYSYEASKSLIIRYVNNLDGVATPIVFQQNTQLGTNAGTAYTDSLSFGNDNSSYRIYPKEFTDSYLEFIQAQRQMMYTENVIATSMRGFTAELVIEFTYAIYIPYWGVRDSVTRGYRIPLTTEVYTLATTGNGTSGFNTSINLGTPPLEITMLMVILLTLATALSVYGLFRGFKIYKADSNEKVQKAHDIVNKYSNEIVVSSVALPLSDYHLMPVSEFKPILMLAINLNKHIMCHHNEEMAEFAVIVDANAYYYKLDYNQTPLPPKPTKTVKKRKPTRSGVT